MHFYVDRMVITNIVLVEHLLHLPSDTINHVQVNPIRGLLLCKQDKVIRIDVLEEKPLLLRDCNPESIQDIREEI